MDKISKKQLQLPRAKIIDFYETMMTIRLFEESLIEGFKKGHILGNMHTYIGEEAIAVGVMKALQKDDMVSSTHRCNGHFIAKGADLGKMMAEMMGREEGLCRGRAGKMHQCAPEVGVICANGIVGPSLLLGPGHALFSKLYNPGQVTVSMFSDGASNQGMFHEGINIASVWKLPVVFVCENNQYAISTHVDESTSSKTIAQRAIAYDIPGVRVDGNDVLAVHEAALEAVDRARRGEGPSLIECFTYRVRGHHEGDPQQYRSKEVVQDWVDSHCPVKNCKALLIENFDWTDEEDSLLYDRVNLKIKSAVDFGLAGTPMRIETMEDYVFAEEVL